MTSNDSTAPHGQAGPRLWVAAAASAGAAFALLYLFGGAAATAETAFRRDAVDAVVTAVRIAGAAMLVVSAAWLVFTGLRRHLVAGSTGMAVGFLMYVVPGLVRMLPGAPGP